MRLFLGFGNVVCLMVSAEDLWPQCSMTNMVGVKWVECLIDNWPNKKPR